MIEHDAVIGTILDKIDELGIADNTIVIYTTDNGPHQNTWPDAGTTPFRSEKNTNWEGAYRVPALIRWPGHIEPGTWSTTASSPASTGSRRSSPPPATRTSPSSSSTAPRSTARSTRTTSTASTSSTT